MGTARVSPYDSVLTSAPSRSGPQADECDKVRKTTITFFRFDEFLMSVYRAIFAKMREHWGLCSHFKVLKCDQECN